MLYSDNLIMQAVRKFIDQSLYAVVWLMFLVSLASGQTSEAPKLILNQPIEAQIKGGETHTFEFNVKAGYYARVEVEQKNIDVIVSLYSPDGKLVVEMNGKDGRLWHEAVSCVTKIDSLYRVEIKAYGGIDLTGSYKVNLAVLREFVTNDQKRLEAQMYLSAGRKLFEQEDLESYRRAAVEFKKASLTWKAVNDLEWEIIALINLGWTYINLSENDKAIYIFEGLNNKVNKINDPIAKGYSITGKGVVQFNLNNFRQSEIYYKQSLEFWRKANYLRGEATVWNALGLIKYKLYKLQDEATKNKNLGLNPDITAIRNPDKTAIRNSDEVIGDDEIIKVDTETVVMLVTAQDKNQSFLTTLKKEDFRILEDGQPQQIFTFQRQVDLPLSLAVLIDVSASQERTLPEEKAAAKSFVQNFIRPKNDEFSIVTFTSEATLEQGPTSNMNRLGPAIDRVQFATLSKNNPPLGGSTAIWDALWVTADEVLGKSLVNNRRAIILLSDGMNNFGKKKLDDAVQAALKSEAAIYAIGISDNYRGRINKDNLRKVSGRTGGRAFFPRDVYELRRAFAQIQIEMRSQYLLAYEPTNQKKDGTYRQVEVQIVNPELSKQKVKLTHQEGYFPGWQTSAAVTMVEEDDSNATNNWLTDMLFYYESALKIFQNIQDKKNQSSVLNNLGILYTETKDYRQAVSYFQKALDLKKEINNYSNQHHVLNNLGNLNYIINNFKEAQSYYEQALIRSREIGELKSGGIACNGLMLTWNKLGNDKMAVFYGKQAINTFQQIRHQIKSLNNDSVQDFLLDKIKVYRRLSDILISEGRLPEAQIVLDLLKDEEFSGLLRRSSNPVPDIPYSRTESVVLTVLNKLAALGREKGEIQQKIDQKIQLSELEKQRFRDIFKEIQTTEAEFDKSIAALAEANNEQDFKTVAKEAQAFMEDLKNLGRGTVALYTLIVNESKSENETGKPVTNPTEKIKTGWIILITPEFRKQYPIEVKDLEKTVFNLQSALRDDTYDPQKAANLLYQKLFQQKGQDGQTLEADLDEYFKDKPEKTLMWSLDSVLRYVPMAALHDGRNYLVEKYRQTVFNPASKARLKDEVKTSWTVLGLGVKQERQEEGKEFPKIEGAERELKAIVLEKDLKNDEGILPGTIIMDEQFTIKSMEDALFFDKNPVVHIASHFSFDPTDTDGTKSFLLLGKGKLTAAEMGKKSTLLTDVDLLTLSACDTGVSGNGKEAEGFAYLAQSLGAKSVIASLWKVSDEGTPELMIRFYQLRAENPEMTKGEAFRLAQWTLLTGQNEIGKTKFIAPSRSVPVKQKDKLDLPLWEEAKHPPLAHPHYWASFILIGNWR
jgi:VWFA-related protein